MTFETKFRVAVFAVSLIVTTLVLHLLGAVVGVNPRTTLLVPICFLAGWIATDLTRRLIIKRYE